MDKEKSDGSVNALLVMYAGNIALCGVAFLMLYFLPGWWKLFAIAPLIALHGVSSKNKKENNNEN